MLGHGGRNADEDGFTLVELLVVIIIIGILASIAIPVFLNQRQKARDASAKVDIRDLALQMEAYRTDHSTYPSVATDLDDIGLTPRTSPGTMVAIMSSDANSYCLAAANSSGTPAGGNPFTGTIIYFWDSGSGGLRKQSEGCPTYPSAATSFPTAYWPH